MPFLTNFFLRVFINFAMNISFGKKIPLYQTQILDKNSNQFEKATLYELDCKDSEDIDYVINQYDAWQYKYSISVDMFEKNRKLKKYPDLSEFEKQKLQNNKFFVLENNKKEMLGLCETTGLNNFFNIQYLESNNVQKKKYKFIGQSILAGISKYISSHYSPDSKLIILDPAYTAKGFYTDKCHFSISTNEALSINKTGMDSFISDFERKTNSPVIDLNA